MTNSTAPDRRSVITDALRRIDDLTAQLALARKSDREPIAVVGMGCRLPGAVASPDELWELLDRGGDAIVPVPTDRWDADALYSSDHTVPGTICNREGGFLAPWDPAEFDAEFFGISPREAAGMDPQHRLLMEVVWEALEHGGVVPNTLRGTRTGVYIGLTTTDYSTSLAGALALDEIDPYVPFGSAHNFAAGRLSYFLGLNGPAVVLDTACSSSLTALHVACQDLRRGDSDAALVAGVNLILSPENSIACSRWGMLAPDGRCKPFDAAADGYVRSEGCGVVALKRLSDAVREGNQIFAVIRGTAVNQDGASSGQTVPNGPAQQALLRQALATAELSPADIDLVESHGTGTALGDPIELDSLGKVFDNRQGHAPLVVGAVKSNLGHLESAAGITGFIKTVLSLERGRIPGNLHFDALTPHATAGAGTFTFPTSTIDWPKVDRPRRAGVSSFGVSGTNAHVIVEQAPVAAEAEGDTVPAQQDSAVYPLLLSGKTIERVSASAVALADWLDGAGADVPLPDIASELAHHRPRFTRVAAVVAGDRQAAVTGLRALASGGPAIGVVPPAGGVRTPGTVFVFSGQGSQWTGMGRQLLADVPAFADAVRRLDTDFRATLGYSLEQTLLAGETVTGIDRIQPVLVGVQLALVELWRARGVTPDAVIGHSMGEVAAAVTAGALTVADGLKVIATRSSLMRRDLAGRGAMAVLELTADDAKDLVARYPGVSVAVIASPRQTVVAGDPDRIDEVIAEVSGRDLLARRVEVDVASHHATVDPILDELRSALAGIAPTAPRIPFYSTVHGGETAPHVDADYWADNLRRPVLFADAVTAAGAAHGTFVEISPHPVLTSAIGDCVATTQHSVVGTLVRDAAEAATFEANALTVLGPAYPTAGSGEDHAAPGRRQRVHLPHTPWLRQRHWITPRAAATADTPTPQADGAGAGADGGPKGWFHQLAYPASDAPNPVLGRDGSRWLVLSDQVHDDLSACLVDASGLPASSVHDDPVALAAALRDVHSVVYSPALSPDRFDPAAARDAVITLGALARLLRESDNPPRLMLLTRNAEAVAEGDTANPVHAAVWGAGRTLALEHPEFWGGMIDVDAAVPAQLVAAILRDERAAVDGEDQVLYRSGIRHVPRLRRSAATAARTRLDGDTAHVVVGATGNIGGDLLRQLARMGATTVVAVSRRGGLPAGIADELAELGTRVVPVAVDAADRPQMTALFHRFGDDLPALGGVYVASLAGGAGMLADLTGNDIDAMFRSKVDALAIVHDLTLGTAVRDFVVFSSVTGILGSRWLGHYTAANAYSDAVAAARRHLGLPARVVDWGLFASWAEQHPETAAAGLTPMPNEAAVACLPYVLGPEAPTRSVIVGADWPLLTENYRSRARLKVVDDLGNSARTSLGDLPVPRVGTLVGEHTSANTHLAGVAADRRPYPVAHRVRGVDVVPVSVLAATLAEVTESAILSDVRFEYPIVLDRQRAIRVRTDGGSIVVESHTDPAAPAARWIRHASATSGGHHTGEPAAPTATADGPLTLETPHYDAGAAHDLARSWGVEGRPFSWEITDHRGVPGGLRADLALPADATSTAAIDAAVHIARLTGHIDAGLMLPTAVDEVRTHGATAPGADAVVQAVRRPDRGADLVVDVTVAERGGSVWLELSGVRFAALDHTAELTAPEADDADTADTAETSVSVPDFASMTAAQAETTVREVISGILANELGTDAAAVDIDRPFPELGLDSMMAMSMLRDAKAMLGVNLSATMLWDHPTVAQLSAHIVGLVGPASAPAPSETEAETVAETASEASLLDELFDSAETYASAEERIS